MGQYWDWSFPYFSDQTHNVFSNKDSAWTAADSGSPLGYTSDYFFRFVIGLFSFIPPETLHYALLVMIFAAGALGVYMLCRPYTSTWPAVLLSLLAFINPAIFYKYTAGHFNYFMSYTLFIFFVYFLIHKFQKNVYSAVVVGLLLGLLGIQIQFFIIGSIFLFLYFVLNREKFGWKYLGLIVAIPLCVNLVWLSNFLTGGASAAQTSAVAAKAGFKSSSSSNFLNIFTFNFSQATLLSRFYALYELLWNAMLFVFLLWLLVHQKRKTREDVALLIFLVVMIFMATGLYQAIQLYPLTVFYPMLREVGHFAPVIVLAALVLVARLVRKSLWQWSLLFVMVGSLAIVGIKFQYFSQSYNVSSVRAQLDSFKAIADHDRTSYRILAYPFFDKYALKHEASKQGDMFPLSNSGHDSFAAFATQNFIQNAVTPQEFQDSVQYKLLQSYDIDVLHPYNVKYIFDLSDIYESNYNLYVPAATYNNDISLIKNDSQFLDKLLAHNPGRLRKLNDHVAEVVDYMPRVATTADMFRQSNEDQGNDESAFVRTQLHKAFDYINGSLVLAPYTTQVNRLFDSPKETSLDKTTGAFTQTLSNLPGAPAKLYLNRSYKTLYYQASSTQVTILAEPAPSLLLNDKPLADAVPGSRNVLAQLPLVGAGPHYLSFQGVITRVTPGEATRLGTGREGDEVDLYTAQSINLVADPSFELGLWGKRVGDCNNYDEDGQLSMGRDLSTASDGEASLLLSATRHNACTTQSLSIYRDSQYLISFDYQSNTAQTASFYLTYNDESVPIIKGSRAITDSGWHTFNSFFTTTNGNDRDARLFLYALEGDGHTPVVNRYDNVRIVKLSKSGTVTIPSEGATYMTVPLDTGNLHFTFHDDGYQYRNLITNPSFEQGAWQPKVGDCNNYDLDPSIAMRLNTTERSDGKQSLELSAAHHDACIHTTANVSPNTNYMLRFDYKTTGTGSEGGYALNFDDPGSAIGRKQLASVGADWHTTEIKVHTPIHANTLTLYLYALEDAIHSKSVVNYDNVSLIMMPDFTDRFVVVQEPVAKLRPPKQATFDTPSQSTRLIHVRGASTPFFVTLSESYHPLWRLELNNNKVSRGINSWLPTAKGDIASTKHLELDSATNAWFVDPQRLCQDRGTLHSGCTKNSSGSYDFELLAEFTPQRWFTINSVISWAVLLGCLVYILLARQKKLSKYRHLRQKLTMSKGGL